MSYGDKLRVIASVDFEVDTEFEIAPEMSKNLDNYRLLYDEENSTWLLAEQVEE